MTKESSDEYRHRTSNLWEAAYFWALGYPLSHVEKDNIEGRSLFVFPDCDISEDDVRAYRMGQALVNPLTYQQGYYEMRTQMRSRDASHQ